MKKLFYILPFAVLLAACQQTPTPDPDPEPDPEPEPQEVFAAPANLSVEVTDGIEATLTWENASTSYDGVELQKAGPSGKFKMVGNIPAGTLTYHDTDFSENGDYTYRLCTFKGNQYSDYASVGFTIDGIPNPTPTVEITGVETASNMIVVRYNVTEDLGRATDNGIVWEGGSFAYWKTLRAGGSGLGVIINPPAEVSVQAYATDAASGWTGYSEPYEVKTAAEPEGYSVTYTDITPTDVPSEIKVYKASTEVTGRPTNIWYAVADLSTGNVVLRTICPSSAQKTSVYAKANVGTPYVFTNGGYFGSGASVSYVLDQGNLIADNTSSLSRTYTYYVSRGVFGVTSTGAASVCWRYGGNASGGPYFYDTPIPQIDGASNLKPTETFPSEAIDPAYYSGVGGGPVLLKDGKMRINFLMEGSVYLSNFELFPSDIYSSSTRQPRTAVGRTADGKVVLMVVDGRNSGVSEGVILTDLARLMKGVGCVDAMNLDGGGSSVFCAGQSLTVLNRPSSSGVERAVFSMIGFAKPE